MYIENIAYADDQVVLVGANFRKKLWAIGQLASNKILDWCTVNKLQLAKYTEANVPQYLSKETFILRAHQR